MPHVEDAPPKVVWKPIPNSSQEIALDSRAHETLYTGARGPGKTETQLMRFRRNVGMGYGSYWRGIIFDREYKNLDDLVIKSKRLFQSFDDGCRFKEAAKDFKWTWPTGEELLFRAVKKIDDYYDYHGQEYPFIGWNELTKFPTGELYEMMKSINRTSYEPNKDGWVGGYIPKLSNSGKPIVKEVEMQREIPLGPDGAIPEPISLEVFSTTNPFGAGHAWVKRYFIDVASYGEMFVEQVDIFNPALQRREITEISRVAIFGTYRENPYLPAAYIAGLEKITDKNKRKAWLAGSWDIVAGGAIDDLWDVSVHVVDRFEVPSTWRVDRSFDWGSTHPFSVAWYAESNGEEVKMPDGSMRIFPSGTIIQISEWYGSEEGKIGLNKGLKMSAKNIALGIVEREQWLKGKDGHRKWVNSPIWEGPADNQISNVNDESQDTTKVIMAKNGVTWKESDKSKGSRVIGLQLFRDRLQASLDNEGPGFYIMRNCRPSIAILPTLPRDEDNQDDIDTEAEDHAWDRLRYRLLAGARAFTSKIKVGVGR